MIRYILSLGSSHEQGEHYLDRAQTMISQLSGVTVVTQSSIYMNPSQNCLRNIKYFNAALAVLSSLHPRVMYRELMMIEQRLGRIRSFRNAPRTMDIDVVFSLDLQYSSDNFFVPHHLALQRNFVILPAIEAINRAKWPVPFIIQRASRAVNHTNLNKINTRRA